MKSIALVTGAFPQLSETFIVRKALSLAAHGTNVTVMTRQLGAFDPFGGQQAFDRISIRQLGPDSNLRGWRIIAALRSIAGSFAGIGHGHDLWELCATDNDERAAALAFYRHLPFLPLRVEAIHFEFLGLAAVYPYAARVLDIPMVVSCRGSDINLLDQQPEASRRVQLEVLRAADAVHCVSEALAKIVRVIRGKSEGIFVNRPAVDTNSITPSAHHRSRPTLVSVGRLVWIKGYDYLLAAIARLVERGLDFNVKIIGDGPLRTSLQFSLMELGIEKHVRLLGAVPPTQVIEHVREADIFVLSSHNEGISNAALEAMAAGLPVVTTNAGGMSEAVHDGDEGYVVPVRDVNALADRLETLILDAGLRRRMGQHARNRAVDEFSIERQVAGFAAAYEHMLKNRGRVSS